MDCGRRLESRAKVLMKSAHWADQQWQPTTPQMLSGSFSSAADSLPEIDVGGSDLPFLGKGNADLGIRLLKGFELFKERSR